MKKRSIISVLLLILLLLSGCSRNQTQETETGYKIYYVNANGTGLLGSSYIPTAETFEEIMEELSGRLSSAPEGFVSALKKGVSIQGYQVGIDALRIDFSSQYYELDNIEEVLLRAAVIKTFSQIPGVMKIMITVNDEQLKDRNGQPVPAMDGESFINTEEGGINSYQYAMLSLYFVSEDGNHLEQEKRYLNYSSNMVLENVVLEQLIQGPENKELKPVFQPSVRILSVYVQEDTCVIDLDDSVNLEPVEGEVRPELAIYALVNSICDTCDDIRQVKIRIDGDQGALFRNSYSLDRIFEIDLSKVDSGFSEEETLRVQNTTEEEKIPMESAEEESVQEASGMTQESVAGAAEAAVSEDAVTVSADDTKENEEQIQAESVIANDSSAEETESEESEESGKDSGENAEVPEKTEIPSGGRSGSTVIGIDPELTKGYDPA